ncbi:hypothetical protein, conserved [Eimeria tenella]|uniref:Polycystin cation channel PKD1/PKD2 domain-containing protein n=1 Tax=Eimeria tenella TaxID=5802 RepID=U6KJI5_EIMTE|nr:hypothetical protein, conserved [Eimeria tenella]CDJ36956.1 hypothetical protein, conserved [Eimeria tenella]|eukprot:XP_013227794.1 hypothetical protein, conserved [Eimeria tenella]
MTERERVQFQDGSERMLVQLTKQQRWERGATATPSALRQQRQLGGLAEAVEQKKTLKDEGYKTNQKFHRQRLFLKDQKTISIGAVLKEQTPLVRREVFRRRLFPIRFEESARSVEEVQQLLMQRKPLGQLMISVCYLAVLLVFISYSLEVNRIFEAANGVSSPIKSALAPTASSFNSLSYEVAKAEGTTPTPADFSESGHPADMLMMSSKAGVASWLLYGFVPLLYGPSPQTSNLGSARVIGNCFRLTFRQVELEGVNGFDLGYEGGWPLAAAEASSSIAASKLSLTTSAAFLLGGTLGNYDVYTMSSVNSILAGIFFVPLFLVFSAFGFTILTAVVLRKHNLCADSVQQGVLKYKLEKQDLFQTRYEWLRHAMASGCSSFWTALRGCWKPQRISVLEEESHEGFQDDVEEAAASKKERTNKKFRSRWREKGKDPIEREQHAEKKHLSIEEDDDSPPQYPSWVWQAMGMEDPINMYSLGSGEKKSFYVDPASVDSYFKTYGYFRGFGMTGMKESSDCYFQPDIPTTLVDENPAPSVDKVYILVRNQSREDHEDAWKKLFVVAFVAITVATVSLQLSIDTSADIRDMAGRAVAKTGFSLDPVTLACEDTALGLANVNFSIRFPIQHVFSITSPRSLYSWLKSDQGLMALFSCHASSPLFNQTFPQSTLVDGTYQQPVLCNWNAAITTRSIRVTLNTRSESIYPVQLGFTCESLQCVYQPLFENTTFRDFLKGLGEQDILRDVGTELAFHTFLLSPNSGNMILELLLSFRRDSGGTVAPSLSVESWKLQPYATWDFATVAAVALQVASAALFLFFGCSFFVEFCRLRRKLKEEREDYSFGLCLGVFFVDDLFNAFDIIGFIVLACAILVWVLHVCSSPHSEVFTLADDLVTASATAASGATEETEATTAAGVLFEAFSSASALMGTYAQLAAAIMAAAFLRLLRIGRKHKRMTMMFYALASSAEEMIQVLIGTVLLFLGFSYLCFLAFGRHMENYSTVKNSFISTIMLTTGFFPLSQLFQSDALMAGAFVFPYLFFMGIICFSLFLSVLLRSLAYRSAEIRAMERLQKIEHRSVLRSAKLFFEELMCNFRVRKEILEEQQKEIQLKHLQEQANAATDFRKRIATERQDSSAELRKSEEAERKRREKPLKVVELPPDVVTSALSDAQYAALPEDIRFFANQEAVLFVDRFRAMATQLKLSSGNIVSLLHQLENEAYTELLKLSREVAQQEGHLRHEASVYTSQVGTGQQRLTAYAKYVEKALQEREEELQLQEHELKLLEARMEGDLQEAERYGGDS